MVKILIVSQHTSLHSMEHEGGDDLLMRNRYYVNVDTQQDG